MNQTKFETSVMDLNLVAVRCTRPNRVSEPTSESPGYSLDSPVQHTGAPLLNPAESGPALSDGKGWSSEPRPKKHSLSL